MSDVRLRKVENLLTWWADQVVNGRQVNGFAGEAAFCRLVNTVACSGSRPLLSGEMRDAVSHIDRLVAAEFSPVAVCRMKAAFLPGGWSMRERASAAGCCLRTLMDVKARAVGLIMRHEHELFYYQNKFTKAS